MIIFQIKFVVSLLKNLSYMADTELESMKGDKGKGVIISCRKYLIAKLL